MLKAASLSTPSLQQDLLAAIDSDSSDQLIRLIEQHRVDVNEILAGTARHTLLHYAAMKGKAQAVKLLITFKADVSKRDATFASPFVLAFENEHWEVADLLKTDMQNKQLFDTDPRVIVGNRLIPLINKLASKGLISAIKKLKAAGIPINPRFLVDDTPLHSAAAANQYETAETLIKLGAYVNVTNLEGLSPLALAVSLGHSKMVQLLAPMVPNINGLYGLKGKRKTLLHIALENDHPELVGILMGFGADLSVKCDKDKPALDLIVLRGEEHQLIEKLSMNNDPNMQAAKQSTQADFKTALASQRSKSMRRRLLAINSQALQASKLVLLALEFGLLLTIASMIGLPMTPLMMMTIGTYVWVLYVNTNIKNNTQSNAEEQLHQGWVREQIKSFEIKSKRSSVKISFDTSLLQADSNAFANSLTNTITIYQKQFSKLPRMQQKAILAHEFLHLDIMARLMVQPMFTFRYTNEMLINAMIAMLPAGFMVWLFPSIGSLMPILPSLVEDVSLWFAFKIPTLYMLNKLIVKAFIRLEETRADVGAVTLTGDTSLAESNKDVYILMKYLDIMNMKDGKRDHPRLVFEKNWEGSTHFLPSMLMNLMHRDHPSNLDRMVNIEEAHQLKNKADKRK